MTEIPDPWPSLDEIEAAAAASPPVPPGERKRLTGAELTERMLELGRRNAPQRAAARARMHDAEKRRDEQQQRINVRHAMATIVDDFPDYAGASLGDVEEVLLWASEIVAGASRDWLVLMGPTGVGKTWQGCAAFRAVCGDAGWDGRAISVPDLFARSKPGNPRPVDEWALTTADVLLLDELREPATDFERSLLDRVIDARDKGRGRVTIVTTNLRPEEVRATLGERIASRISRHVRVVVMEGPDRRRHSGGEQVAQTLPLR